MHLPAAGDRKGTPLPRNIEQIPSCGQKSQPGNRLACRLFASPARTQMERSQLADSASSDGSTRSPTDAQDTDGVALHVEAGMLQDNRTFTAILQLELHAVISMQFQHELAGVQLLGLVGDAQRARLSWLSFIVTSVTSSSTATGFSRPGM